MRLGASKQSDETPDLGTVGGNPTNASAPRPPPTPPQLFRVALQDSQVTHLVLISGDAIPLYSFKDTYQQIGSMKSSAFATREFPKRRRYRLMGGDVFVPYEKFRKQRQWMISTRAFAHFAVKAEEIYCVPQEAAAADEHYFIGLAEKYSLPYHERWTTYDEWSNDDFALVRFAMLLGSELLVVILVPPPLPPLLPSLPPSPPPPLRPSPPSSLGKR